MFYNKMRAYGFHVTTRMHFIQFVSCFVLLSLSVWNNLLVTSRARSIRLCTQRDDERAWTGENKLLYNVRSTSIEGYCLLMLICYTIPYIAWHAA